MDTTWSGLVLPKRSNWRASLTCYFSTSYASMETATLPKTDIIDISRRCGLNNLRGCKVGLQVRLPLIFNSLSFQRSLMSAPSRRPEIRRRRTRNEKIAKLRKRLSAAQSDADKTRLTAKLHRMSIGSPGEPLLK
jgi:hypothetical protein